MPCARPLLRVQILSFLHTKFLKRTRLGSPCPPYEVHAPPYGKSWIRHCYMIPYYMTQLNFNTSGLAHLCRQAIRKHLIELDPHENLFSRIPKLGLPAVPNKYLLYNVSLDNKPIVSVTSPLLTLLYRCNQQKRGQWSYCTGCTPAFSREVALASLPIHHIMRIHTIPNKTTRLEVPVSCDWPKWQGSWSRYSAVYDFKGFVTK